MDELDMIAAEAAQIEAEAAQAMPGTAPTMADDTAPVVDPTAEWIDAANMGCGLVVAVYPELKDDWNKDRLDALGVALAKCADRYGWTVGELFGHPLVGLAFAAWPLGASLVRVAKAKAEEKAKSKPTQAAEAVTDRPGVLSDQANG